MGFNGDLAQQQFWEAHVRFGSEADISLSPVDVRFTPESGHSRAWLESARKRHRGIYTRRQPTKHKTSSKEKDSEGGNRPTGREGTSLWRL